MIDALVADTGQTATVSVDFTRLDLPDYISARAIRDHLAEIDDARIIIGVVLTRQHQALLPLKTANNSD